MGGALFPPCYLPEVKLSGGNEDKWSSAGTDTLSVPKSEAGHHRPTPQLETPGHSQASPGQSFVGSLLLSLGSWCA